jgi:S-adenosylmethionine:diacylglycerol 3-amino-3-carboxypropyl transferase
MNGLRTKVFEDILYAQCWEDSSMDRQAFHLTSGDTVFSITSGGCNVLAFLVDNPKKVIALDINPYQNFMLLLKMAAFTSLTYDQLLEFMGVRVSAHRWELYLHLRPQLSGACLGYWDSQQQKIDEGIINCGRYEHYMALLRRWIHRLMGRELIDRFYETHESEARTELFDREWDNLWWKFLTRILLSRTTMALLFDRAFFRFLDSRFSFARHFAERTRKAFTGLPMRENYFLSYILLGRFYDEAHLPPYLRHENFEAIRKNLHRVDVVNDSCEHFFSTLADSCITRFNFTNIFEWMSPEDYEQLLRTTIRVATDGAVLTYRNLLVRRERPVIFSTQIESLKARARILHEHDLSFIYNNYVIERITKGGKRDVPRSHGMRPEDAEGFSPSSVPHLPGRSPLGSSS